MFEFAEKINSLVTAVKQDNVRMITLVIKSAKNSMLDGYMSKEDYCLIKQVAVRLLEDM